MLVVVLTFGKWTLLLKVRSRFLKLTPHDHGRVKGEKLDSNQKLCYENHSFLKKLGHLANLIWSHCLETPRHHDCELKLQVACSYQKLCYGNCGSPCKTLTLSSNLIWRAWLVWILWAYPLSILWTPWHLLRVGLQEVVDTDEVPINIGGLPAVRLQSFL